MQKIKEMGKEEEKVCLHFNKRKFPPMSR